MSPPSNPTLPAAKRSPLLAAVAAAVLLGALLPASPCFAATAKSASPEAPIPVAASNVPPPGRKLSADRVLQIAEALPKMKAVRAKYRGSYGGAYLKGPARWQVSFFSKGGNKEIGQAIIADADGRVLEQWTGWQVAWSMARGYPGAFGHHVDALWIWLPLCLLFLLPFARPPFTLLHLDLLVLLSFSVSLAFFNHAHIEASVPLAYPPLIYLLARMLWLLRGERPDGRTNGQADGRAGGWRRARAGGQPKPEPKPVRLLVPVPWLALGVMFLIGFRVALNVTDSNVIDVGYAGVIGAQKVAHGDRLYGGWPSDNEHGDTYGPVAYESYVPFEQIFGWSGTWDDLPAAHAAAIFFDLLALALLFWLGLKLRGPTLGVLLAYAWASYPFTLFALESNSNDTLVAVFVLAALLCASSTPVRLAGRAGSGVFAALAGLTKIAPLALAPVLATHGTLGSGALQAGRGGAGMAGPGRGNAGPGDDGTDGAETVGAVDDGERNGSLGWRWQRRARAHTRASTAFLVAFIATAALVSIPALTHDSLHEIYVRTLEYQANRDSPFSIWGLYGWHTAETIVEAAAVVLAVALAVIRRRDDMVGLAAACAAILIAAQLGVEHWFYLYIPWFFGLTMLVLLDAGIPARPSASPFARFAPERASADRGFLGEERASEQAQAGRPPWRPGREPDVDAHQPRVLFGGLEPDRHLCQERLDRLLALDADHAAARAGHADVGDVGGAARQDPRVGGRHVCVGADDGGHPAVEQPAERDLLGGGLGVHVHEHVIDLWAQLAEGGLDLGERAAAGLQIEVAAEVDDAQPDAVALEHTGAVAGLDLQEVGRPQDPRLGVEVGIDLAAMVGVVAERDRVDAAREQGFRGLGRDPQAAGHVLAVDDYERRLEPLFQAGQAIEQGVPTDAADEVADEQDAQLRRLAARPRFFAARRRRVGARVAGALLWLSHTSPMIAGGA
jgi:hypothetical protein